MQINPSPDKSFWAAGFSQFSLYAILGLFFLTNVSSWWFRRLVFICGLSAVKTLGMLQQVFVEGCVCGTVVNFDHFMLYEFTYKPSSLPQTSHVR